MMRRAVTADAAGSDAASDETVFELVVAVSDNDVIGRNGRLPWRLPGDLRHFKCLTWGRMILMGRKTYESIGKALPGRSNLVLSHSTHFLPHDCRVVRSLGEARLAAAEEPAPGGVVMVIGGAEIYRQCIESAVRIHLTQVHCIVAGGDAFFSEWRATEWREVFRERHEADAVHASAYSFVTLQREVA